MSQKYMIESDSGQLALKNTDNLKVRERPADLDKFSIESRLRKQESLFLVFSHACSVKIIDRFYKRTKILSWLT
jgi:hypothetical protein